MLSFYPHLLLIRTDKFSGLMRNNNILNLVKTQFAVELGKRKKSKKQNLK